MNLLFLGSMFPNETRNAIRENSKGAISNANDTLQWAIIEGLAGFYPDLVVVSLPNIGAYPTKYKKLWYEGSNIKNHSSISGKSVSFLNLVGLKHLSRYFKTQNEINNWFKHGTGQRTIVIYDLHVPFLLAAANLKKKFPELKLCVVVPDLHGYTGSNDDFAHRIFDKIENLFLNNALLQIDCFVLLSKFMKEKLPIEYKPWVVIEGIFKTDELTVPLLPKIDKKIIFYSGSLDQRNGVLILLEAFKLIDHIDYELVICGEGDTKNIIIAMQNEDKRISYKGQLPRNEILSLQKQATLLVNPRTPEGEFTKYSFPSKTMEYLASGTPVLMYKLEGVPEEYFQHCFTITNTSPVALSREIISICEQDQASLKTKGQLAKDFILNNKTPLMQCAKIYNMLKTL